MFKKTITDKSDKRSKDNNPKKFNNLINNPKIIAKTMFDNGPANPVRIVPFLTSRKLLGLKGTGLA